MTSAVTVAGRTTRGSTRNTCTDVTAGLETTTSGDAARFAVTTLLECRISERGTDDTTDA